MVLFRCDWFDTHSKKCRMKDEGFLRSIMEAIGTRLTLTQATKVFYLKDNKHADDSKITESWRIVQIFLS